MTIEGADQGKPLVDVVDEAAHKVEVIDEDEVADVRKIPEYLAGDDRRSILKVIDAYSHQIKWQELIIRVLKPIIEFGSVELYSYVVDTRSELLQQISSDMCWNEIISTTLTWAAEAGQLDMVKYITRTAPYHSNFTSTADWHVSFALRAAAEKGHLDIVMYLVDFWDATLLEKHRTTQPDLICVTDVDMLEWALERATRNGHAEVAQFLQERLKK